MFNLMTVNFLRFSALHRVIGQIKLNGYIKTVWNDYVGKYMVFTANSYS